MGAPVIGPGGKPLLIDSGGGVLIPAIADDPCDCCDPTFCPEQCDGNLPEDLAFTMSGWTVDSFLSLNGTFVVTHVSGCVWQGVYDLAGACDLSSCNNPGGLVPITFSLVASGGGWSLTASTPVGYGFGFISPFGGGCTVASLPFVTPLSNWQVVYSGGGSPVACTGDVTLSDGYYPRTVSGGSYSSSPFCREATQTRPQTLTLHLP